MKQFLVIGLGNFGAMVATELIDLKCKVTAIDTDRAKVQSLPVHPHLVAIIADATDRNFLEKISVEQFESAIISTGKDSHASILIALHLKELGLKKIVAKANSQDHAKILQKVGATNIVIPEREMAVKISHSLAQPNLIDYLPLTGDYNVAELIPPESFINKKMLELRLRTKYQIQVIAVKNSSTGQFNFVLDGDYKINKTDILVVLGKEDNINKMRE